MNKEYDYSYFENRDCQYYPCHKGIDSINCLFCYCPMYRIEQCLGNPNYKVTKGGKNIKVCSECTFPHLKENYPKIIEFLRSQL